MINKFREFAARAAVLAADESGMSTVEYANVALYTPGYWQVRVS